MVFVSLICRAPDAESKQVEKKKKFSFPIVSKSYDSWAKSDLLSAFVNKILLENNQAYSFTYCMAVFVL